MIAKLSGILDSTGSDWVAVDVGGVGYVAFCSGRTLAALPPTGSPVSLLVETHVREDHIHLYGFLEAADRDWFRLLTTVQGVGARVALAVQSVLSATDLMQAVLIQDKAPLTRASGVGPKLATRIVTELRGKVPALGGVDGNVLGLQAALGDGIVRGPVGDAVSALVNLGYSQAQASAAVARVVAREGDGTGAEKLIRLGLRELSS